MQDPLIAHLARETDRPIPEEVHAVAEAAKAHYPPGSIEAVLYYGSCFRDGYTEDALIDLYLLASNAKSIHPNALQRLAAFLIPPNVYYVETQADGRLIRAKYALLPLEQFEKRVSGQTRNPYFWARFAQPTGLVEAKDRLRILKALAAAATSLTNHARQLSPEPDSGEAFWTKILSHTYRTELRVEKPHRSQQIVRAGQARYAALWELCPIAPCNTAPWWLRRIEGRMLSVLRLAKAAFTFQSGPDYLVWKIERHTGQNLNLTAWQKRHPILASPPILWRLWRNKTLR